MKVEPDKSTYNGWIAKVLLSEFLLDLSWMPRKEPEAFAQTCPR